MGEEFLKKLNLPAPLGQRILCRAPSVENIAGSGSTTKKSSFVLYLPTVVLRKRQNPGFALACRIANHYEVPLIVLCTVLDDHHLTRKPHKPVCMTARRLAFTLEALQSCTKEWEEHGAGVAIRVHGTGARIPHHLTLAHNALAVVSDEPFVEPFRTYLCNVVGCCLTAKVPCFTVDGSTTVPPRSKLQLAKEPSIVGGDMCFQAPPAKAWIWEKQTDPHRKAHVYGAVNEGYLDAPPLQRRLPPNFFLDDGTNATTTENDAISRLAAGALPSKWKHRETPSPSTRPWTVEELLSIKDVKHWSMTSWPGADTTVSPCRQTHGSQSAAQERWNNFLNSGMVHYAKRRNQIVLPHAVSRISCYLNLGILSIMDVVSDVWQAQNTRKGYSAGCQKFLDEVIKWREIGYVHTFAMPGYHTIHAIPKWSQDYLRKQQQNDQSSREKGYTYDQLDSCTTKDDTWNAMQSYLVETGELHNNARMTWGKTVVHWQATMVPPEEVLWQLVVLNDRYALDGLSPPSYAGLLWCFGWCDKPGSGGSVSSKWAHRYRQGPEAFELARERLYHSTNLTTSASMLSTSSLETSGQQPTLNASEEKHFHSTPTKKTPRRSTVGIELPSSSKKNKKHHQVPNTTKNILSYFAPVAANPSTTSSAQ